MSVHQFVGLLVCGVLVCKGEGDSNSQHHRHFVHPHPHPHPHTLGVQLELERERRLEEARHEKSVALRKAEEERQELRDANSAALAQKRRDAAVKSRARANTKELYHPKDASKVVCVCASMRLCVYASVYVCVRVCVST